ncbi:MULTISPECIES: hypothetical protein [Parachlamydia]|jgi:hypothetical protein|uniref:Prolyl 4-hydroxylase alpha subunit Fe(2+) 2OG dioxygenase domain-containing protein n=2 Tax=Parachlamydia acanthamoebae TaxID=83552 RepID=F8KUY7_PARAV|nr:hypothetical protein [Parachlamydia acanthamoebae]EFB41496.1 hypothetical protein pah_c030o007 [Parachlamydia acanthamoebae str. Hall's coccus]CCB85052.1 putative uncharacterized protein [Parachlamydia acanthamoebae UV-7]
MELINESVIRSFPLESFLKRWPFPWHNFHEFLTEESFKQLHDEFPPLELFEYHENLARGKNQRPHNRYYLAYEKSKYSEDKEKVGAIHAEFLSPTWQKFLHEIETNAPYQNLMKQILGEQRYQIRYAWHMGISTNEVSPHCDNASKVATHIFYFNTSEDWDLAWGGALLVLGDKLTPNQNPDFQDFMTSTPINFLDNYSFLFKNTPNAWHGVKALKSPPGKYRRLFNVIYDLE